MEPTPRYHIFETGHGFCGIAWSPAGITRFSLATHTAEAADRLLRRKTPGATPAEPPAAIAEAIAAAIRYFAGEKIDFAAIPLDLSDQDDFPARIYAALRRVGYGETTTYGTLAKQLGAGPETARDVGQAMGRNPVPLIIPCHRVLAANGKLGGFSAPGGTTAKLRMLAMEGVTPGPPPPAQGALTL